MESCLVCNAKRSLRTLTEALRDPGKQVMIARVPSLHARSVVVELLLSKTLLRVDVFICSM